MNNVFSLPSDVCEDLKQNSNIENVKFITKFPNAVKSTPLSKSIVCIGLKGVKFSDSGIGCCNEKIAEVELEVIVCVPLFSNSTNCVDIIRQVYEFLWKSESFNLQECNIFEVIARKDTGAYELKGNIKTQINVSKEVPTNE